MLIVSGIITALIAWIWLILSARVLGIGPLLLAGFLPLVTLFLRQRGYALAPRLLLLVGVLLVGAGLALLQRDQPERFDALLSGDWLGHGVTEASIEGELVGQRFLPNRVFWQNNELVFTEGDGDRVRRSLTIRFTNALGLLRQRRLERLPGDEGPGPELVLQWYAGALAAPGLRRVVDGYSLSLEFAPQQDGRTIVSVHLHLPGPAATRLTGDVWLEQTPAWVLALEQESVTSEPAAAVITPPAVRSDVPQPERQQLGEWQVVSLLAVLDEPELFLEQNIRLVTVTDRVYEGRLKAVSADQRVVVAQTRGPNQVDFHFHPLDIRSLEVRYRSRR